MTHILKTTTDDWFLPFDMNLVRVSLIQLCAKEWRVCIWGQDDFGMEKDFASKAKAEKVFLTILHWEDVTRIKLEGIGFITA
jgi:hypothetical protein